MKKFSKPKMILALLVLSACTASTAFASHVNPLDLASLQAQISAALQEINLIELQLAQVSSLATSAVSCPNPELPSELKAGMTGSGVFSLQNFLWQYHGQYGWSFDGILKKENFTTGVYDNRTTTAVKDFQKQFGVASQLSDPEYGNVFKKTRDAIYAKCTSAVVAPPAPILLPPPPPPAVSSIVTTPTPVPTTVVAPPPAPLTPTIVVPPTVVLVNPPPPPAQIAPSINEDAMEAVIRSVGDDPSKGGADVAFQPQCPNPLLVRDLRQGSNDWYLNNARPRARVYDNQVSSLQAFLWQYKGVYDWRLPNGKSVFPELRADFVTGNYRVKTRQAVGAFQMQHGIASPASNRKEYGKVFGTTRNFIHSICENPTPPPPPVTLPIVPDLAIVLPMSTSTPQYIRISFSDNSTDEDGFALDRGTAGGATTTIATFPAQAGASGSWQRIKHYDYSAVQGITYRYQVRAFNAGGTVYSQTKKGVIGSPALPIAPDLAIIFPASTSTPQFIKVSFSDNSTNEDGFAIDRGTLGGATTTLVTFTAQPGTSNASTRIKHYDFSATPGTTYYYQVRAFNAGGSVSSQTKKGVIGLPPPPPPPAGDLVISNSNFVPSQMLVGGSTNMPLGGFRATAIANINTSQQRFHLRLTSFSGYGVASIRNISLYQGSTFIAGPASVVSTSSSNYGQVTFSNTFVIPGGVSEYTLRGNLDPAQYQMSLRMGTVPANDWIATLQASGATITPSPLYIVWASTMNIVPNGNYTVSVEPVVPVNTEQWTYGGINQVTLNVLKFTATSEPMALTDLRLQLDTSGSSTGADFRNIYLYNGATLVQAKTSPAFLDSIEDFQFPTSGAGSFVIPQDSTRLMTLKVDLPSIAISQAGTAGQLVGTDYDGARAKGPLNVAKQKAVGLSSGISVHSSTDADRTGNGVVYFRSVPQLSNVPLGSQLINGSQPLYRFNVQANGGNLKLNRVTFAVATSGITAMHNQLPEFRLFSVTNNNSVSNATGAAATYFRDKKNYDSQKRLLVRTEVDSSANYAYGQYHISQGTSHALELRGTVADDATAGGSVTVTLLGDNARPTIVRLTGPSALRMANVKLITRPGSSAKFVWSDLSSEATSAANTNSIYTADWMNGYRVPGLPETGLATQTKSASAAGSPEYKSRTTSGLASTIDGLLAMVNGLLAQVAGGDVTPPTISWGLPDRLNVTQNFQLIFANIEDAGSGINAATVKWSNNRGKDGHLTQNGASWFAWYVPEGGVPAMQIPLERDANIITIRAEDNAGNSVSQSRTIVYRNMLPQPGAIDVDTRVEIYRQGGRATNVNVRSSPAGRVIGTQTYLAQGMVKEGPEEAALSADPTNIRKWWRVEFDVTDPADPTVVTDRQSGWVWASQLRLLASEAQQCTDLIDNDNDGRIDFPDDSGCTSPLDSSELDRERTSGMQVRRVGTNGAIGSAPPDTFATLIFADQPEEASPIGGRIKDNPAIFRQLEPGTYKVRVSRVEGFEISAGACENLRGDTEDTPCRVNENEFNAPVRCGERNCWIEWVEARLGRNTRVVFKYTPALPDLRVQSIEVPKTIAGATTINAGDSVQFGGKIINASRADAGEFKVRFLINVNYETPSIRNIVLKPHASVAGINGVGRDVNFANVVSPVWKAVGGKHKIRICADLPTNSIRESDERNNCKEAIFNVVPAPNSSTLRVRRVGPDGTEGTLQSTDVPIIYEHPGGVGQDALNPSIVRDLPRGKVTVFSKHIPRTTVFAGHCFRIRPSSEGEPCTVRTFVQVDCTVQKPEGRFCAYNTSLRDDITTKIVFQYESSEELAATGAIRIRRVGSEGTISTVPAGTVAKVKTNAILEARAAENPAVFRKFTPGAYRVAATDKAGFSETAGTCSFPRSFTEEELCTVATFNPVECDGLFCWLPNVDVQANTITKVLFKYSPL